jgi:ABC-2 type transporter/CDR ABC transporter
VFEVVARERAVLYREQAARYYNSLAWSLAVAIVELPYLVLQSCLFVPIVYHMVDLAPGAGHVAFYLLVFFLNVTVFTFFGFTVLFLTPDNQMAQIASAGVNYLSFGVCGYLVPWSELRDNWFFMVLNRISPTTWSIYAIMADQQGTNDAIVEDTGGLTVAEYLDDVYGYRYDARWQAVGILAAFVGVFSVGAALALRYVSFNKR